MEALSKAEIRRLIKARREMLSPEDEAAMNEAVFERVVSDERFIKAGFVYTYVSFGHEADTKRLLEWMWQNGKKTAVPRVEGKNIEFYIITSWDDLEAGTMGIPEPKASCHKASESSAYMLVPGVAFDKGLNRLGYGGGYYDRFFCQEPKHYRAGLAFDFQILQSVPAESFDKKTDGLFTPSFKLQGREICH